MALSLDDFVARKHKGPRCTVTVILAALDAKDRDVLTAALTDPDVQSSQIAQVLTDNGHKIGEGTVAKHRRKGCACDRR